jgi:hypothetical protein
MKGILKLNVLLALLLLSSCEKTELAEDKYFIRSFGANANSSMSFIYEKADGGYLLGGRIGVPAYVGNAFSNVGEQKFIESSGSAMIIADRQANTVQQRIYPMEAMELANPVYVDEMSGTGRILQIFPRPDGGYFAVGEFRNLGIGVGSTYFSPSTGNVANFLLYLNADMEVEDFESTSAPPGQNWDGYQHVRVLVRPRPGGGFLMMIGINFEFSSGSFRGFQLVELDDYGRNPVIYEYYGGQFRVATDFNFMPNGDIVVVGQDNFDDINLFLIDGQDMTYKFSRFVINDGVGTTWNTNPMFVLPHDDGTVDVILAQPNVLSLIVKMDQDFNSVEVINIEPEFEEQFPRSACLAPNGDLLILNDDLTGGASERSFLYRFSKQGERKFRVAFDGPGRYVTNASDGSILVLADLPFNGVSVKKSTLYKLSPNGTL